MNSENLKLIGKRNYGTLLDVDGTYVSIIHDGDDSLWNETLNWQPRSSRQQEAGPEIDDKSKLNIPDRELSQASNGVRDMEYAPQFSLSPFRYSPNPKTSDFDIRSAKDA
jgi:hypothetical protein